MILNRLNTNNLCKGFFVVQPLGELQNSVFLLAEIGLGQDSWMFMFQYWFFFKVTWMLCLLLCTIAQDLSNDTKNDMLKWSEPDLFSSLLVPVTMNCVMMPVLSSKSVRFLKYMKLWICNKKLPYRQPRKLNFGL